MGRVASRGQKWVRAGTELEDIDASRSQSFLRGEQSVPASVGVCVERRISSIVVRKMPVRDVLSIAGR